MASIEGLTHSWYFVIVVSVLPVIFSTQKHLPDMSINEPTHFLIGLLNKLLHHLIWFFPI